MSKKKKNSQPRASAPGNPLQQTTTQECIDPQIDTLIKSHLELSYDITTDKKCVYWILDLKDSMGMRLAQQFVGNARIQELKAKGPLTGDLRYIGTATELSCLRTLVLEEGKSALAPPPSGSHYIVAVTGNSCAVALPSAVTTGHQGLKQPASMNNHKMQSQPEPSAPHQHHEGRLETQSEFSPEQILAAVTMRPLIEANPHEVYRSGRTMAFTFYAVNATSTDSPADELCRLDPSVCRATKSAFDAQRSRILRNLKATHYACAFPLKTDTEVCPGCMEILVVIGRSKDDQCIGCIPVLRNAQGNFAGLGEMFITDVPHNGEPLIEKYFTQNANKAAPQHFWNYIPGNN